MEERKTSIDTQIYNCGVMGDLSGVKRLYEQGGSIDMALMGATQSITKEENSLNKERKKIASWAIENGATLLFGIQQEEGKWTTEGVKQPHFFSRLTMKGGPGEVKRGTFKEEKKN
jgi:hypothetical protein